VKIVFFFGLSLFASSSLLLAKPVDLGINGKMYEIIEEDANEFIQKRIKKLDIPKIEESMHKSFESAGQSNLFIKTSYSDEEIKTKDVYLANRDIADYTGKILYREGEAIPTSLSAGQKIELCFVDGSLSKEVLDYIVNDFGKSCKYIVNKKEVSEFHKLYRVQAFPMSSQNLSYLDRYGVTSSALG